MIESMKRIRDAAHRQSQRLARGGEEQAWPMRLYSGGGLFILSALACTLLGVTYRDLHATIFILGAILLALGILLEGYRLADKGLATRPGKVLAALVATMIGALSMAIRSEEHTSELQSLMRNSYAVLCLKKKKQQIT